MSGKIRCRYDNGTKRFLVERLEGDTSRVLGHLFRESFEDPEIYLELEPGEDLCASDLYQLAAIVSDLEIGVEDLDVQGS